MCLLIILGLLYIGSVLPMSTTTQNNTGEHHNKHNYQYSTMDALSDIQLGQRTHAASQTILNLDKWQITKTTNCQSDDSDDSVVSCTCTNDHDKSYNSLEIDASDEGTVPSSTTVHEIDVEMDMYIECDSGFHGDKSVANSSQSDNELSDDEHCHGGVGDEDNGTQIIRNKDNQIECQSELCSNHGDQDMDEDGDSDNDECGKSDGNGDDNESEKDDENDDDKESEQHESDDGDGGWMTEDDKDDNNSVFESDAEDNVPELPLRFRGPIQSYPTKRVYTNSSPHSFHRQNGHIEKSDDDDDSGNIFGFLYDNNKGNNDSAYYYDDNPDEADEYNYLTCYCYCTGIGYAFPNRLPRTIKEVVNFWQNDFQVGDYIYPSIGSWEEKGLVPERYDDIENYRKFIYFKSLYYKFVGCNRSSDRWYRKYAGKTLSEIACCKSQNHKRHADSRPSSPVIMDSGSNSETDEDDCHIGSFFDEGIHKNCPNLVNKDNSNDDDDITLKSVQYANTDTTINTTLAKTTCDVYSHVYTHENHETSL